MNASVLYCSVITLYATFPCENKSSPKNITDVNAAKAQALEQGMVDVFDVYLVVDGVPQRA